MKTFLKYSFCSLWMIFMIQSMVQAQTNRTRRADRLYDYYLYNDAIISYERIHKKDAHIIRRLAESYRLTGDYEMSEKYYTRLFTEYKDETIADDYWNYAEVLRMNERYEEAYPYLVEYRVYRSNELRMAGQISDPYYYQDLQKDQGQFSIRHLKNNTDESEFGAGYDGELFVFATSRQRPGFVNYQYNWNERGFYDLYVAKENPNNKSKLKGIKCMHAKGGLNGRFNEGPASFNENSTLMVLTRNSYLPQRELNAAKVRQLELWYCVRDSSGAKWGEMQPMPFNSIEYSVGHAALTPDGNTMYFVSDMPGGYGQTDIYYSTRNSYGNWSAPINAGPKINTEGREMFPFYHSKGMLFFASDGHPGLGGLDVFMATASIDRFGRPKNVGVPVNSPQDDFAFILDKEMKDGYFSSNRPGGKGLDDIYGFDLLKPFQLNKKLEGYTRDALSGVVLPGTVVRLYSERDSLIEEVTSDANGYFTFEVEPDVNVVLKAWRDKYKEKVRTISTATEDEVIQADMLMEKIPVITLVATATDFKTKLPLEGVQVLIRDRDNGNVIATIYTDASGVAREPLDANVMNTKLNYNITFSKDGYIAKTIGFVHTVSKEGDIHVSAALGKIELGLDIGKLIELNPIYFDYNKWNIRPDAAVELDKIVEVMKAYPDIEIELGSHADCRGSKKYNMTLTDKRAKSSAAYIISKGISKDRIYGKGYGESQLVNGCECEGKVKSKCGEDEHALNRRTEFLIVKINVPQSTQK